MPNPKLRQEAAIRERMLQPRHDQQIGPKKQQAQTPTGTIGITQGLRFRVLGSSRNPRSTQDVVSIDLDHQEGWAN